MLKKENTFLPQTVNKMVAMLPILNQTGGYVANLK